MLFVLSYLLFPKKHSAIARRLGRGHKTKHYQDFCEVAMLLQAV